MLALAHSRYVPHHAGMESNGGASRASKLSAEKRDWIASREAIRLVGEAYALHDVKEHGSNEKRERARGSAADALLRRLTDGTLLAKPVWFRFVQGNENSGEHHDFHLVKEERTINPNFWRTLVRLRTIAEIDWIAGDFAFEERDAGVYVVGSATGVRFDRAALPAIDVLSSKQTANPGGAPRKWDWDGALLHLAALAHRNPDGLLQNSGKEPNQTDIARYLQAWFIDRHDDAPESSQLRFYGSRFLYELNAIKSKSANNLPTPE